LSTVRPLRTGGLRWSDEEHKIVTRVARIAEGKKLLFQPPANLMPSDWHLYL